MQPPKPSFIQVGETYFATVRRGLVETILEENGKHKPFESAARAMRAAIDSLKPIAIEEPACPAEPDLVSQWREEKAREVHALQTQGTLLGVQVVRRKRRAVTA